MTTLVIILAIVATASVVALFLTREHPEQAASHGPHVESTTSQQLYGSADRPAGPGAETMDADRLGGDHRPPA
jgi:hypothetical protein